MTSVPVTSVPVSLSVTVSLSVSVSVTDIVNVSVCHTLIQSRDSGSVTLSLTQ